MFVWIIAFGAALLFLAVVLAIAAGRWQAAAAPGRWSLWLGLLVTMGGCALWALDVGDAWVAAQVEDRCPR